MNRGTVGVNSLPAIEPGPSAPESSTLTIRLPSHPRVSFIFSGRVE